MKLIAKAFLLLLVVTLVPSTLLILDQYGFVEPVLAGADKYSAVGLVLTFQLLFFLHLAAALFLWQSIRRDLGRHRD